MIDDLASVSPWVPRGLKVNGTCKIDESGNRPVMVIHPAIHWSWGIEEAAVAGGKAVRRRVVHG